jgi:hypothetical protein
MRLRPLPNRLCVLRLLLVPAVACAVTATYAVVADAGEDRTSRRSAEMALPDPYLDPAWPDEAGEEMEGRYAPGKSDSVEEVPLGDELEMQEELRALQEPTVETPPAAAVAPGVATRAGDAAAPAPTNPEPYVPQEDDEAVPDPDQRDPVEW